MEAKKFGKFIAEIRKERKMTQADLATEIHVTDKAVSRWERGLGFPDIQTIEPLAQALGISVLELMRSEQQEQNELQYTKEEVAEILQSAGDISTHQRQWEKNANLIAVIFGMGIAIAACAAGIASLGGIFFKIWKMGKAGKFTEPRPFFQVEFFCHWLDMRMGTVWRNCWLWMQRCRSRFTGHYGICFCFL